MTMLGLPLAGAFGLRGGARSARAFAYGLALALACSLLAALGLPAARASGSATGPDTEPADDLPRTLVIVHTADLHGQVTPLPEPRSGRTAADATRLRGGIEALASAIADARADAEASGHGFVYLDAGDFWQGSPESDSTGGGLIVEWFRAVGLTAVALGEHDFDAGAERMAPLLADAPFAALSANLRELDRGAAPPYVRPAIDIVQGGVRVSVIGLIDERAKELSAPRAFAGLDVLRAHEACEREVRAARRRGAEVVVVLSHCGPEIDRELAAHIRGIDVLLGGRTDVGRSELDLGTGALVQAVAPKGRELGRVEVTVRRGAVVARRGTLVEVFASEERRHEPTRALVERLAGEVQAAMDEVLGEAPRPLVRARGFRSSALGSWTADLMRARGGTDVALHNKEGLAGDLAAGPLRVRDLYEVSPFENDLVTLALTGRELRAALEWALSDPRFALEVSGVVVRYDLDRPVGERVVRLDVGGAAADPDALYTVTTNSFLAKGGHGHRWLATEREQKRHRDAKVLDLQLAFVRERRTLDVPPDDRIAPAATTMPQFD